MGKDKVTHISAIQQASEAEAIELGTVHLRSHTLNAIDSIDAALFSGDEFVANPHRRRALRAYMARWERQIKALAEAHHDRIPE